MDILVYSNLKEVYINTDTSLAKKILTKEPYTKEDIRYACKLDYIHTGNVLAEVFNLSKTILNGCPTYASICDNASAVSEIMKVPKLKEAFLEDVSSQLDILDIMQNFPELAVGYLQEDTFLRKICSSVSCLRELVKNPRYCSVVQATINNHRALIRNTLESNGVPYQDVQLGSGAGTWTHGTNANTLMMVWQCYDDSDTDYSVYHGDGAHRVAYISRHGGTVSVDHILCLRGVKLVGMGSTVGFIKFRHYSL